MWYLAIRSLARRLGAQRYASASLRRKQNRWRAMYKRDSPTHALVGEGGWRCEFPVENGEQFIGYMGKTEDLHLLRAMAAVLKPGDICWDVGANVGIYTSMMAKMVGQEGMVVAFEPEGGSRSLLHANVKANGASNVRIEALALGRQEERMVMVASDQAFSGVHHIDEHADPYATDAMTVQVLPGDMLVADGKAPGPDFVKIDVEGFEVEVLEGMRELLRRPQLRAALIEVHFALLESRGLRDAPIQIERTLAASGLSTMRWLDRSHLFAQRLS